MLSATILTGVASIIILITLFVTRDESLLPAAIVSLLYAVIFAILLGIETNASVEEGGELDNLAHPYKTTIDINSHKTDTAQYYKLKITHEYHNTSAE